MVKCPRCGREGSLHKKTVKGGSGKRYPAYYMAHYLTKPDGKKGVKWCHIPKSFIQLIEAETLKNLEDGERFFNV